MATAVVKGPMRVLLQTSAGQYVLLGMGAYALFPEKFHKMLEHTPNLMRLVSGNGNNQDGNGRSNTPIIIHTPSPTIIGSNGRTTWVGTLVYTAAGATACWAGYIVAVQVLPDTIGQFLPVTRTIFEKTSQSLGKGILKCKEVLEEKIMILVGQQEQLSKKQDDTNRTVSHIKGELGEARIDLTMLQGSMDRCEDSLEKTEGMQQFTLRGVRLLVRCVANMLPDNPETANELAQFIEEEQRQRQLEYNSHNNKSGSALDRRQDIVVASAVTPATPAQQATTPQTTNTPGSMYTTPRRSSMTRRCSSEDASFRKALEDVEQDENTFSDIHAMLGR
eukprot:scaffold624_cov150-Cylindrotheca_fusiformis.AAC.12